MLVRSVRDGLVYVRTRKYATYHEGGRQLPIPEVQYHQPIAHSCITKMLSSSETIDHPSKSRLVSSYFKFFNLRDVDNLMSLSKPLPELLIWNMFEDVLSALQHLHCNQNLAHGDISTSNVFVNLKLGQKFPEFFLGDFGLVAPLLKLGEKGYTADNEDCEGPQAQISLDLCSLRDVIVTMAVGDAENRDEVSQTYSRDLCNAIQSLEDLTGSVEGNYRGYLANMGKLQKQIMQSAGRCLKWSENVDLAFLKAEDAYTDTETFDTVAAALNADFLPPGPWQVVKVDQTWRILQKDQQTMMPLRCRPLKSA